MVPFEQSQHSSMPPKQLTGLDHAWQVPSVPVCSDPQLQGDPQHWATCTSQVLLLQRCSAAGVMMLSGIPVARGFPVSLVIRKPDRSQLLLCWQVYDWDFNVFDVHKQTGGRPLFHVTMALLEDQGLFVSSSRRWGVGKGDTLMQSQ